MITNSRLPHILKIITKIFLIGLLLQFFLQTFVTFELNLTGPLRTILWMRKEIVLVWLFGLLIYFIQKHPEYSGRKPLRDKLPIRRFIILFVLLIWGIGILSLFITDVGLSAYALSIRYSMIGFFIFILFFVLAYIQQDEQEMDMVKRYNSIIKKILIGAVIRRGIIRLMPNLLDHFGYNQYNVEGKIWIAPPATYYTQYNEGYVRNQFLFERPISLGFFLVALWPLFFMFVIKKRGRKNGLRWGGIFGLVIFSTFSRAARIARFFQTWMLILLQYQKHIRKILLYGALPVIILGGIVFVGKNKLLTRNYSDIGHFTMITQAIEKIKEKPLWGQGAGTAWPASYQLVEGGYTLNRQKTKWNEGFLDDWGIPTTWETISTSETKWLEISKAVAYNPENQFLQIRIEYGIFGFIGRMALYLYLHKIGYTGYLDTLDPKKSKQQRFYGYIIVAFSLGLLGLSIEWLVLHSFVDRMVVYPFMALFGLAYAVYYKSKWVNN